MSKNFNSPRRTEPKKIDFTLDGDEYVFRAGKIAPVILSMASEDGSDFMRSQLRWFLDGLTEKAREHIEHRINDPEDPFDMDTLNDIIAYVIGKASSSVDEDRPTMPYGRSTDS